MHDVIEQSVSLKNRSEGLREELGLAISRGKELKYEGEARRQNEHVGEGLEQFACAILTALQKRGFTAFVAHIRVCGSLSIKYRINRRSGFVQIERLRGFAPTRPDPFGLEAERESGPGAMAHFSRNGQKVAGCLEPPWRQCHARAFAGNRNPRQHPLPDVGYEQLQIADQVSKFLSEKKLADQWLGGRDSNPIDTSRVLLNTRRNNEFNDLPRQNTDKSGKIRNAAAMKIVQL
jgi:hypothetical protein